MDCELAVSGSTIKSNKARFSMLSIFAGFVNHKFCTNFFLPFLEFNKQAEMGDWQWGVLHLHCKLS